MTSQNNLIYEFGPFKLVPAEKQLLRDGESVSLTPKSFDLLVVLVENAGHLVEKAELMNRVWPDSFVEEANLSVKMSELRRVLARDGNEDQYIETVPRRGYRFVAPVTEKRHEYLTSSDGARTNHDTRRGRLQRYWPAAALIALLVVGGLLLATNALGLRDGLFATEPIAPIRSLAVLPLENLSGDASQDYFADGMTEALITDLAKIRELRVVSRASVIQYKGTDRSPAEIARELNVEALLTGSVVRSGDRVRITVLLVHVPTDRNLWAESYDRDLSDVLDLQRAVTLDVVRQIRVNLSPKDPVSAASPATVKPHAYDDYLRGKFHLHRQTKIDNDAAIAALETAVEADPNFAAAHAELAQAYIWKLFLFDPAGEREWSQKAFVSSEKALSLDPNLAVAYLARGRLLWTPANNFPHERVIPEYRRALALDPSLDEARNQLALVYNHVGAFDEALKELQAAVATNPGNALARFRIGQTLLFQGKHGEALEALRQLPDKTNPALVGHQVAWALLNLGRKDEALQTLRQFPERHPNENTAIMESIEAVIAAGDGRKRDADTHIETAIRLGKGFGHFHHTTYYIAVAHAQMNRPDEAVKWLETTAETGFPCYPLFQNDRNLDNIRNDPAFVDFLSRMHQKWEMYRSVISSPDKS